MGINILKKMRVAILLVLAIAMSVKAQSTVNPLQACITEAQLSAEHIINALDGAVTMDTLKAMTEGVAASTEIQKAQTACKAVKAMDAMMWLDQHTTPGQQACISTILAMLMDIPTLKKALNDSSLTWQQKMKAFSPIVEASEKIIEGCVPAA